MELLAPAKNKEIGIAAINCGADAVYIAASAFGARKAAGNSLEDIAELCDYAHRFGARIFVTVNTIFYDSEASAVAALVSDLQRIGVDALIVQDMGLVQMIASGKLECHIPLHASTQCAVRTPEKAQWLASLGFSRIVVERHLSLDEIRAIAQAVPGVEIEAFVHGAICTGFSGQCYLSEALCSRSANRGECAQACRSRYDLVDASGHVLLRDKLLLSLKDYCLIDFLPQMAAAGVMSFKIEGRLKGASYVKNVVSQYSAALNQLVSGQTSEGSKTSWQRTSYGNTNSMDVNKELLEKTFNRGYTTLYINGRKDESWAAGDVENGVGEFIGEVVKVTRGEVYVRSRIELHNADGFAVEVGGKMSGFRASKAVRDGVGVWRLVCETVPQGAQKGSRVYRNLDFEYEKQLEKKGTERFVEVHCNLVVRGGKLTVEAKREDGAMALKSFDFSEKPIANNRERVLSLLQTAFSKKAGDYRFVAAEDVDCEDDKLPLMSAAELNEARRLVAEELADVPYAEMAARKVVAKRPDVDVSYKENVANRYAAAFYGVAALSAYEIEHQEDAELMRTRHCVKREAGLCPRHDGKPYAGNLFLVNNGVRLALEFDCRACEMVVKRG